MCMREISPCGCKTHFLAILMLIRRKPVKKKEELVKNAVFSLLADTKSKELGVSFFFFWATFITNHKKTRHLSHKLHEYKYPWDKENCLNNLYFAGDQSILYVRLPLIF